LIACGGGHFAARDARQDEGSPHWRRAAQLRKAKIDVSSSFRTRFIEHDVHLAEPQVPRLDVQIALRVVE
jgi:hypothetical protein